MISDVRIESMFIMFAGRNRRGMRLFCALWILLLAFSATAIDPEQVHLAYWKTPDVMAVQWATPDRFCEHPTVVQHGQDPSQMHLMVGGACFKFDMGEGRYQQSNHIAYMNRLQPSTRYYYRVGDGLHDDNGWSQVYNFKTAPAADTLSTALPQRFLICGDISATGATILPTAALEAQLGAFDMILHVGSFSFSFDSHFEYGINSFESTNKSYRSTGGDSSSDVVRRFVNEISSVSAYVPYMVDRGIADRSGFSLAHYTEFYKNKPRNAAVTAATTSGAGTATTAVVSTRHSQLYYSWNVGLIHFISVSTELYFERDLQQQLPLVQAQLEWLQSDLLTAQLNRSSAPWIIIQAHHSIYCSTQHNSYSSNNIGDDSSSSDECESAATRVREGIPLEWEPGAGVEYRFGMEQLLQRHGVDLWINSHSHHGTGYERMLSTHTGSTVRHLINPLATLYIVTSDAHRDPLLQQQQQQPSLLDRTAFQSSSFGYSRMTVHNASHLHWEQVDCSSSSIDSNNSSSKSRNLRFREQPSTVGTVVDSFWLVQHQHGPFAQQL